MQIVTTIVPIFIVVLLGWGVHRRGFLPAGFTEPANRMVYYLAIPAMIFQSIAKSNLRDWFNPLVIILPLIALAGAYMLAWAAGRLVSQDRSLSGTFIQSSGQGNLGYIGLAVAYYFLGESGLAQASLIAGFMIITQNVLSVITLQYFAPKKGKSWDVRVFLLSIITHPIILSVIAGLMISLSGIALPLIIKRSLSIISGLALPTALLIIGASLSLGRFRQFAKTALGASAIKLLLMPAMGWGLFRLFQMTPADAVPAVILLASPSATVCYVMAREMCGHPDLAVATISASTLLSAVTIMLWLKLSTGL